MKHRVALLHTVAGLLPVFADLGRRHLPDVDIFNIVDESLLQNTVRAGRLHPGTMRRVAGHLLSAADAGADAILVTCSSIGPAAEATRPFCSVPIVRVDEGMAIRAVETGKRIGVLATAVTTLEPTRDLIERCAARVSKRPRIIDRVCAGAFENLAAGDTAAHDRIVAAVLERIAGEVDVVVLAQASMGRVIATIPPQRLPVPVLTSPESGILHFKSVLATATV